MERGGRGGERGRRRRAAGGHQKSHAGHDRPHHVRLTGGPRSTLRCIIEPKLSQSLTAVILAAGHGTRMRSRIPKVLHPICGRPMLDYVIDAVTEAGAKDLKVIANPHHPEVAGHLDERGIAPTFQRDPKGTAHALMQVNETQLKGKQVLVLNGDSPLITKETIKKVIEAQNNTGAAAAIATVIDPTRNDGRV